MMANGKDGAGAERAFGGFPVGGGRHRAARGRSENAGSRSDLIHELMRMFRDAKAAAPPRSDLCDPHPFRRTALQPAVNLALCYTAEQGLLPRRLDISDLWEGLPVGLKWRQGISGA
jgi:hypothetical protein